MVGQAFREWADTLFNERLQHALDFTSSVSLQDKGTLLTSSPDPAPQEEQQITGNNGVVTTEDELEGFRIVRAILARIVDPARIYLRDPVKRLRKSLGSSGRSEIREGNCEPRAAITAFSLIKNSVFTEWDDKEEWSGGRMFFPDTKSKECKGKLPTAD